MPHGAAPVATSHRGASRRRCPPLRRASMPAAWSRVMARCPSSLHPPLLSSRTTRSMLAPPEPQPCDQRWRQTAAAFSRHTALILQPATEALRADAVRRCDGRACLRHGSGYRHDVLPHFPAGNATMVVIVGFPKALIIRHCRVDPQSRQSGLFGLYRGCLGADAKCLVWSGL